MMINLVNEMSNSTQMAYSILFIKHHELYKKFAPDFLYFAGRNPDFVYAVDDAKRDK